MKIFFSFIIFFSFLSVLSQEDGQILKPSEQKSSNLEESRYVDSILKARAVIGERVEYEPKDSVFLELYKDVVFKTDKSTLKIWKDGIRIFFDPSVPRQHQRDLMKFADKLSSQIDSLSITQVNSRPKANYLIYYMNNKTDYDFEPRIKNSSGGYYVSWNGKQQLYRSSLKINSFNLSKPQMDYEVLKYYFFLSLGYFGSSKDVPCESFVSTCPENRVLTNIDLEILKYHYSYGICKGVNRETFEELHSKNKKILKETPNAKIFVVHQN